ncbi:hypothetical protein MKW98_011647 [Papaver atlanticum]|uniref:Uncharacterized protein n=1 Tax=Papaver atlanticum TaxID=357466 RepID=A0AAD4S7Q6_9MAGN|nr:hypothetical protein MKW98_011647 [Papaver atlanticum]
MGTTATKPKYSKSNILDTSSKSINETVNGSHEYVIRGYSLSKGIGVGKFINSFTFTVGGYEWGICFFPDGQTSANKEFVSLFVALLSPGTDVRALFELKLLDQSGKGRHKVDSLFDSPLETGPFTLKSKGSWGFPQYLKRSVLENSNYLKDDCLVIHCTVGVVGTRVEGRKHYAIPVPPSDMIPSFKSFLESGTGSDVTFQVGDKLFKAHKLVVATRSPVFKAQFYGLVGNPGMNTVVIEDFDPIAFKVLLLIARSEQHHCVQLKTVCLNFAARPENLGGFAYLEESCPSLLLELLETVAVADNSLSSVIFNWKRNGNNGSSS